MASGSEDLVLKISADTTAVAKGLAPMEKALGELADDAEDTDAALRKMSTLSAKPDTSGLDKMTHALDDLEDEIDDTRDAMKNLSRTEVTLSIKEQAIQRARDRIEELRDRIADEVVMGVSTKEAERELAGLQSSVKKLTDTPAVVDVEMDLTEEVRGVESLREGALGMGEAFGQANGSMEGFANIGREAVPMLADMNDAMVQMQEKAALAGTSMGRMGRAASAVTSVMAGPWGLAIAAGVGLLTAFASSSDAADDAARQFAESIDYQTGKLEESNRAIVAKRLNEGDALLEAERLGVSTKELVDALLDGGDAAQAMQGRLNKMLDDAPNFSKTANDARDLSEWFRSINNEMDTGRAISERTARAIGDVGDASSTSAEKVRTSVSAWDHYEDSLTTAQKALDDIVASLDILNGRFADSREAQSSYEKGVDDLNQRLKENKISMNLSKEAGRENDALVRAQAKNIEALAKARLRDMETSGESSDQILADYEAQRKQLIIMADKLGLSGKAAKDYVDKLLATPKEVKTEVKAEGVPEAEAAINHAARDRDTAINVKVVPNMQRWNQLPQRLKDAISGNGDVSVGLSAYVPPTTAPAPAPRGPSTVFMQPRLYLDSRPIRAALRGDVESTVASAYDATRTRGRM